MRWVATGQRAAGAGAAGAAGAWHMQCWRVVESAGPGQVTTNTSPAHNAATPPPGISQPTQKYDPHHDYFSFAARDDNGGNRMATVLMYLTNVEEGGETVFPKVLQRSWRGAGCMCAACSRCSSSIAVPPYTAHITTLAMMPVPAGTAEHNTGIALTMPACYTCTPLQKPPPPPPPLCSTSSQPCDQRR
jgi:hypothetical protein